MMKFLAVLGCCLLLGLAAGEAPYPPSGTRPQGALLVLPSRQVYSSSSESQLIPSVSLDRLGQLISERLRVEEGAQSGTYQVFLPDGRLQSVRYTSAPLKRPPPFTNTQQFNFQNAQTFGHGGQVSQQSGQASRFQGYTEEKPSSGEFDESNLSQQNKNDFGQYKQQGDYAFDGFSQPQVRNQFRQQPSGRYPLQQQAGFQGTSSDRYAAAQDDAKQDGEAASNQHSEALPSKQVKQNKQKPEKVEPSSDQPESTQPEPAAALAPQQPQPGQFQAVPATQFQAVPATQFQAVPATQFQAVPATQFQAVPATQFQAVPATQFQALQPLVATSRPVSSWSQSYVAQVQFADVQPLAAPVYSYTTAPLVRILRYAPKY